MKRFCLPFLLIPLSGFSGTQLFVDEHRPVVMNNSERGKPALIRKEEGQHTDIYRFQASGYPAAALKETHLQQFRKVKGFINLKEENGAVEIHFQKEVDKRDAERILLFSARMYGYIGYEIAESKNYTHTE